MKTVLNKFFLTLIVLSIYFIPKVCHSYSDNANILQAEIDSSIKTALALAEENKLESSISIFDDVIKSCQTNGLDTILAKCLYSKAYAYDINGKSDSALILYEEARIQYEKLLIVEEIAQCMNAKGVTVHYAGDLDRALALYLEALEYQEKNNLLNPMAKTLNNVGVIYRNTDKNEEAIKIYKRALSINEQLKDTVSIGHQYNNMGVAYTYLNQLDEALSMLDSSLLYYTLADYKYGIAFTHNSYGDAYYEVTKDLPNARKHLVIANELLKSHSTQYSVAKNSVFLGKVEIESENYHNAIDYLSEGLKIIEDTERKDLVAETYKYLSTAYAAISQSEKAYSYLQKHQEINEKLNTDDRLNYIEEMQSKYELSEKEKQIQIQELRLVQNAKERRSLFLIVGLLLVGILMSGWFIYNKIKTNKLLDTQKGTIQKALTEKEILLKEIHHRVKNNLQVVSSLLVLQGKYSSDPLIEAAIKQGSDRVKSMSLIHQNLYQKENLTGVDVQTYFKKLFESLFYSYNINPDLVKLELDIDALQLDVDSIVPIGLIVNELVSNALKHAFPNEKSGKVQVGLKEVTNQLILTVQDNGIGLTDIDILKSKNTLGFELIDVFAKKIKATMEIKNQGGTKVELKISKYKRTD